MVSREGAAAPAAGREGEAIGAGTSPFELALDVLQIAAAAAWTLVCVLAALAVLLVTRRRRIPFLMARRLWAPGLFAIGGVRLSVTGGERLDLAGPTVFASNHQSYLDTPVLFAALPVPLSFILKEELRRMPLVGWYAAAMGMVFVDRHRRRAARETVEHAAALLRSGRSVVLFPEGTRSPDGELAAFKSGGFAAPIAAGAAVVPIAIAGAGRVLPPRGFAVRAGTVRVVIGSPIPVDGLAAQDRDTLAAQVRARVGELLAEARVPTGV